jgi:hypothetical protein
MLGTDARADATGSMVVITPLSAQAREWITDNTESEPWQWYAGGLCVDHRYAQDIVLGMRDTGLSVSTANCYY